jgi:hypothetical protein
VTDQIKQPSDVSKVIAPTKPNAPPKPSKVVTFSYLDGVWSTEVTLNDKNAYFTNRDFNQMTTLLTVRKQHIRRAAFLKYLENQKKKNASQLKLVAEQSARNELLKLEPSIEGQTK